MSFTGKVVKGAMYGGLGLAGYGLIQGAGELGEAQQSRSAATGIDNGANIIACYNAVELMGGDSTFVLNDGLIVGVDLAPADEGVAMYGTEACDEGQFANQMFVLPPERRDSSDDLLEAGNTTISSGIETQTGDNEGEYQMGAFVVLATAAAVVKRGAIMRGHRNRREAKRALKAERTARRNNPPRDPGDWTDTPC